MLDHIGMGVKDLEKSKAFYAAALAPLGISVLREFPGAIGIGKPGHPFFWLSAGDGPTTPIHVAFTADTRAQVDEFHRRALAAGAKDNGAPGLRPQYHANYYGAFVIGPDGHNIEAVCHK